MYQIVGTIRSRAFRVLWMLEELSQPYEHIPAQPRSEQASEFNPAGKVPTLMDNGVAITDSTAIIQYLADRHGALTFPAGTIERAQQDSLTQFLLDEFDAALWVAARHTFILPEELRHTAIKDSLRWEFARSQKVLTRRMGDGPFLMGADMTVPDIILTHCGNWAEGAKFPIDEPALVDYLNRMRARPAFKRVMGLK
ncbi:MAG: glutathione S-transferase family protein [Paracoccaceae bacterium]